MRMERWRDASLENNMVKVSFHAMVVHGKREEGMHSRMVMLLVVRHKDDRFIHLVLTMAASVVARDGMNGY